MKKILPYLLISFLGLSSFPTSATILFSNIEGGFQTDVADLVGLVPNVPIPVNPSDYFNVVIGYQFSLRQSGFIESVEVPIMTSGRPVIAAFGIFEGLNPIELFNFTPTVGNFFVPEILSATLSGTSRLEAGRDYFFVGLAALNANTGGLEVINWNASSQTDTTLRIVSIDGGITFSPGLVQGSAGFRINGNVIPIPATTGLFALGFMLLSWSRRRV